MCKCGCNTCETKNIVLHETVVKNNLLSEGLRYHVENQRPITDNIYRYGSDKYLALFREVRYLYARGLVELGETDTEVINESHLGEYGFYVDLEVGDKVLIKESSNKNQVRIVDKIGEHYILENGKIHKAPDLEPQNSRSIRVPLDLILTEELMQEIEYQGKKVQLNKPKRGGAKKFYVYVRDPKTKRVKKVSFGDTSGLSAKINNPKARKAFADRHDCKNKKDKTKAGYWSCRLPRYAKLLGLKGTYSGFW